MQPDTGSHATKQAICFCTTGIIGSCRSQPRSQRTMVHHVARRCIPMRTGALRCAGVRSVARSLHHASRGHLALFPPTQILSRMVQILGSRFTSSPKGRRALPAALAAAPSAVIPIVEAQILRRERMPVAAGGRRTTRTPLGKPEQLERIGKAHNIS